MENNEILERLLQDDKQSTVKEEVAVAKQRAKEDMQISRIRVVTAKYKVYIVLLLIFICILLITYIPKENDAMKSNKASFDQVNSRVDSLNRDIRIANEDMDYLCNKDNGIVNKDEALKNCLNTKKCSDLPDTWKIWTWSYDLSVPVSYLQTNSLYNKKMPVDEKRVLKNLNEYLIKQNILWNDKKKVWDILRIEIWDPKPVEGNHFFTVSVDVEIKFDTVGDLTGFLYNVEKKMIDNREDRILYKIQSVSYDVVSNDEPQVTDISMLAYYYYDERFDNRDITIFAKVDGDTVKLEQKKWNNDFNDVKLKEKVKKSKDKEIEANDLFELPEWMEAKFKNWKWIDMNKQWEQQEIKLSIWRGEECSNFGKDTSKSKDTDEELDSWDNSGSILDWIFKKFKK